MTASTNGRLLTCAAGLTALLLVGCGGSAASSGASAGGDDEVAQGQRLFRSVCHTCHGPNAEGMPALGKNLHDNQFVTERSVEELAEFFAEGRAADHPDNQRRVRMPPRGGNMALSDDDLRLIAVYLKSLQ